VHPASAAGTYDGSRGRPFSARARSPKRFLEPQCHRVTIRGIQRGCLYHEARLRVSRLTIYLSVLLSQLASSRSQGH